MHADIRIMDELRRVSTDADYLATRLHVSVATVSRALRRLRADGLVRKGGKHAPPLLGRPAVMWKLVA